MSGISGKILKKINAVQVSFPDKVYKLIIDRENKTGQKPSEWIRNVIIREFEKNGEL